MKMLNIYKVVINGTPWDLRLNGENIKDVIKKVEEKNKGKKLLFVQMDEIGNFHKIK